MTASKNLTRKEFLSVLSACKTIKDFDELRAICSYAGKRNNEINLAFQKSQPSYMLFECPTFKYEFNKTFTVPEGDRTDFGKTFGGKKVRVIRAGTSVHGRFYYNVLFVKIY